MFRGQFQHAIDGKGRTSLPARFREVLAASADSRLVITTGLDRCLVAYSMAGWQALEQEIASMPKFNPAIKALRRVYFSAAVECDIDKLGRVLLPANLRSHANLDREVLWCGSGEYLELWNPGDFETLRNELLDTPESRAELERALSELGV